jgi:hypothetical protein
MHNAKAVRPIITGLDREWGLTPKGCWIRLRKKGNALFTIKPGPTAKTASMDIIQYLGIFSF